MNHQSLKTGSQADSATRKSHLWKGLVVGATLSICGACLILVYRESFTPTLEVEKGNWIENGDSTAMKTMQRIQKYSKLDLPKDSSASFYLYAQKGFSDAVVFLRIAGSEDYIQRVLTENEFVTDWGEMEERVRIFFIQDKTDQLISAGKYMPKSVRRWWKPEEVSKPRIAEMEPEDTLSGGKGMYGTGEVEDTVLYLRIVRE